MLWPLISCSILTKLPKPPPYSALSTVPAAIAEIGVPAPGTKSTPLWSLEQPRQGADRSP